MLRLLYIVSLTWSLFSLFFSCQIDFGVDEPSGVFFGDQDFFLASDQGYVTRTNYRSKQMDIFHFPSIDDHAIDFEGVTQIKGDNQNIFLLVESKPPKIIHHSLKHNTISHTYSLPMELFQETNISVEGIVHLKSTNNSEHFLISTQKTGLICSIALTPSTATLLLCTKPYTESVEITDLSLVNGHLAVLIDLGNATEAKGRVDFFTLNQKTFLPDKKVHSLPLAVADVEGVSFRHSNGFFYRMVIASDSVKVTSYYDVYLPLDDKGRKPMILPLSPLQCSYNLPDNVVCVSEDVGCEKTRIGVEEALKGEKMKILGVKEFKEGVGRFSEEIRRIEKEEGLDFKHPVYLYLYEENDVLMRFYEMSGMLGLDRLQTFYSWVESMSAQEVFFFQLLLVVCFGTLLLWFICVPYGACLLRQEVLPYDKVEYSSLA